LQKGQKTAQTIAKKLTGIKIKAFDFWSCFLYRTTNPTFTGIRYTAKTKNFAMHELIKKAVLILYSLP
jgi:hypothetical protein